ncbi:DUF1223 domain-containing protein [Dokdonella sp.]|uniref:DUF1223 domain-containing protein n=1 Tax=Dokdonella sp. TaxID=2291710 RepID=UPI002F3FBDE4
MHALPLLATPLIALATAASAACVARGDAARIHLVELYTSEGCSSCPPAERWLSTLRDKPGYAGLEFHVDYWDSAEWRDPYSDARHTARQKAEAKFALQGRIYTPQVFVDGRAWKNWPKAPPPQAPDAGDVTLSMELEAGDTLEATLEATAAHAQEDYRMYVALTEDGLANTITGGENRGATLAHDGVVRALAGPFALGRTGVRLETPAGLRREHANAVAFVQDERRGDVVQVVRVRLRDCAGAPTP